MSEGGLEGRLGKISYPVKFGSSGRMDYDWAIAVVGLSVIDDQSG